MAGELGKPVSLQKAFQLQDRLVFFILTFIFEMSLEKLEVMPQPYRLGEDCRHYIQHQSLIVESAPLREQVLDDHLS
jgi:hypothetical protein